MSLSPFSQAQSKQHPSQQRGTHVNAPPTDRYLSQRTQQLIGIQIKVTQQPAGSPPFIAVGLTNPLRV